LAPCSEPPGPGIVDPDPGIVEGEVADGMSVARPPGVVTPVVLPDVVAPGVRPEGVALGLVAVPLGLVVVELDCAKATLVPTSSAAAATEEKNNFILAYLRVLASTLPTARRGDCSGRNPGGAERGRAKPAGSEPQ
jgi:hypothetical protein